MPDYDTITVPAGEKRLIRIGDNDTFENTLIDMTATGASAQLLASGNNWTVRNVAFKGNHPGGHYLFTPGVPDEHATATVENLYMGDGQTEGSGKGGIWVNGSMPHRGTITFRNVHVARFVDNGLYGMDSGYYGVGGVIHIEDSYFDSNNIANIRTGSHDGRICRVENTVVAVDPDRVPPCGVGCSSPGAVNSRGLWAWWGPVSVTDCDIAGAHIERDGGDISATNTRWGAAAQTDTPPAGVPMSAEAAASGHGADDGTNGDDGGDGGDDDPATDAAVFTLVSADDAQNAPYSFTATGSVQKKTDGDTAADANDTITPADGAGVSVEGVSGNGYGDAYYIDGSVVSFSADPDDYTLTWDGAEVTAADLPFRANPDPDPDPDPGDGDDDDTDDGGDGRPGRQPTHSTTGDGSTTSFTLAHGVGSAPESVSVESATKPASSDHWISEVTADHIVVEYASPPAADAALGWYLSLDTMPLTGGE